MAIKKAVPAPFTKGVNFTNWMEFRRADQINPELFTKKDFEKVKKLGCDVVRIPMHFETICEGIADYTIPTPIHRIPVDPRDFFGYNKGRIKNSR